jgi:deazaflavin-dependent oxidoreductase (nitroreductase family)
MRMPDRLARFNRHVTNPIQLLWAGRLPGYGIVEHIGRKSGKPYRTPVSAYVVSGGFAVILSYGPDRDWVRNLTAAGQGKVVYRGRTIDVVEPEVVTAAQALSFLPKFPAFMLNRLKADNVLRLHTK